MLLNIIIINIYFVSLNFIIQFLYTTFHFRYNMTLTFLILNIYGNVKKKCYIKIIYYYILYFIILMLYISPLIEDNLKHFS
jgi:hypothetical protein